MALINFDLTRATPEFRKGFLEAMRFMDGMPQGDTSISLDYYDETSVGITIDDGGDNDNATYRLHHGDIVFDSSGVER